MTHKIICHEKLAKMRHVYTLQFRCVYYKKDLKANKSGFTFTFTDFTV